MKLASLSACGLLAFAGCAHRDALVLPDAANRSKDVALDIRRMWGTQPLPSDSHKLASTEEAVAAAHRVFSTISFRGKTRSEVIALLGDPQRSSKSIYNFPFYPAPGNALVYRFDTGAGGWQFDLLLSPQSIVRKTEAHGIE